MICMFKVMHYCLQMFLKTLAYLKIKIVKLELLANIDMLLMVENGIRGGICQAAYRYAEANNKYMDD